MRRRAPNVAPMGRRLVPAALVLATFCSAGCGSTGSSAGTAPAGSAPVATAPTTTVSEPFSGSRSTVTGSSDADATALLEQIDVGHHEGFDRVVFRFRGTGVPGYRVGFVERPLREDGSGNEVAVEGEKIIGVRLEPASGFDIEGGSGIVYHGPKRIDGARYGTQVITELARTGDFEAVLNWAIALSRASDFRVLRLDAPARLVVDVRS
jgi:hypothetical protein